MSQKQWIGLAIGAVGLFTAAICCLGMAGLGAFYYLDNEAVTVSGGAISTETSTPIPYIDRTPVVIAAVEPTTTTTATPVAREASLPPLSTEQKLLQAVIPVRDQRLLAMRLKYGGEDIPQLSAEPTDFQIGESRTFWVTDNQDTPPRQFQATAILQYRTDHSYWWVEEGFTVNESGLARSARQFEAQTYPTNRAFFGSEWSPGVDQDERVHIFMGNVPGVAGYFSASNEYTRQAEPYSNEHEMFFINLKAITPGNDYFDGVLAHEFQHMIHWHQDRNEDTWINEGMSELATYLNGYGSSNFVGAYTSAPDTQLTGWADSPGSALADYGASFLFMLYFLQQYGEDVTQAIVANPQNGVLGFDTTLADYGHTDRFEDIFADFLAANYLDNEQWGYQDFSPGQVSISARHADYPITKEATVYQYGSDYIELAGPVTLTFTGSTRVKVIDNDPHSGRYYWYSHRGDDSNSRLTRAFDLSQVDTATLSYWTWYDIESDWDYGYVEISTDGGQSWTILQTPHSATENPSGNAYGPGYTGSSGGWLHEELDISAYAGQPVLIRFEYVTDDAVNHAGWTVDDISLPEIGFYDDVENGPAEWQAEGFVRIDNILAQEFLVQILEMGPEVRRTILTLDETNRGSYTIDEAEQAILIISGLTPVTTEPASYQYRLAVD